MPKAPNFGSHLLCSAWKQVWDECLAQEGLSKLDFIMGCSPGWRGEGEAQQAGVRWRLAAKLALGRACLREGSKGNI